MGGGSSLFWKNSKIFPFFNYEISPQGSLQKKTRASRTTGAKGNNLFTINSRLQYHVKRIRQFFCKYQISISIWQVPGNMYQSFRLQVSRCQISRIRYDVSEQQNLNSIYRVSDIEYQISSIKYRVTDIEYQISSIRYRVSDIQYQISSIRYQVSNIKYQISSIRWQVSRV